MTFSKQAAVLATLSIVLLADSAPAFAAEAAWSFVGTWKITTSGATCAGTQTVNITAATSAKVRGSTTPDGKLFGQIVSGSFNGTSATFYNKFYWGGQDQAENWSATLSKHGNFVRGVYKNTNGHQTCKYWGPRIG